MSLLEKMFSNFNKYFNHYIYYQNFKNFKNYIDNDKDLSNAKMLIKYNSFEKFNLILKEISETNEEKRNIEIETPNSFELETPFYDKIKKIERIDDNHFFIYSNDTIKLIFQDENDDISVLDNTRIEFNDDIESVTLSFKKDKIYVCLSDQKIIKIFNCDLINGIMELNNNEIRGENFEDDNFIKCIELPNNILAAAENHDKIISLWNLNSYLSIYKISIETCIGDLLLINSDYFISSQPNEETIIFHNINDVNDKKLIKNINSANNTYCLTSNNNYILVCCLEGISVLSIKHKELIQFFETSDDYYNSFDRCIKIDEDNNIYYLYYDSDSYSDSKYINFEIFKLEKDKMIKIISSKCRLEHENNDRKLNIHYLGQNKSSFIADGRIFICDKYDLDYLNKNDEENFN